MGRKVWTRERLTAADLNDYLMDQAVMVFASASARDAAIPVPEEGMVAYLQSIKSYRWFDGASWRHLGGTAAGISVTVPTVLAGYTAAAGRNPACYLDGSGVVHVVGAVTNNAGFTPPGGTDVLVLPAGMRPPSTQNYACGYSNGVYNAAVSTGGGIRIFGPSTAMAAGLTWAFDGITFLPA